MALAPQTEPIKRVWDNKKERRDAGKWLKNRGERNYLLAGPRASCSDDNYGNVAVFSKKKFRCSTEEKTSFILSVVPTAELSLLYFGVVDVEFCQRQTDFRIDSEYGNPNPEAQSAISGVSSWLWGESSSAVAPRRPRPGNVLIGQKAGRPFNMSINLMGDVFVCGEKSQSSRRQRSPIASGEIEIRVDIFNNEVRFTSPDLWGHRVLVENITFGNEFRLALSCPRGFACELSELTSLFTLEKECFFDLGLTLDELQRFARRRCRRIVKKIQFQTSRTPINIVVVGEFGAGKSALINTISTLFGSSLDDRPKRTAFVSETTNDQGTRVVNSYVMRKTQLRLLDSIGIGFGGDKGQEVLNYEGVLGALLRGEINEGFENANLDQVQVTAPRWRVRQEVTQSEEKESVPTGVIEAESLGIDEMNHGALLVGSAVGSSSSEGDIYNRIERFCGDNGNYPVIGVVTHVDVGVDDLTLERLYTDAVIGGKFNKARKRLRAQCFPVKCYTKVDTRQNVLHNLLVAEAVDALFVEALEYKRRTAAQRGEEIVIPEDLDSEPESDGEM